MTRTAGTVMPGLASPGLGGRAARRIPAGNSADGCASINRAEAHKPRRQGPEGPDLVPRESQVDLYATKAAANQRLIPLVDRIGSAGVSPDVVTLSAIPIALAGGASLLGSGAVPALLLLVPPLVLLRILLNLIDGNLARRTGRIHPRGELYNELGDRLADIAFLAPVSLLPGASAQLVLLGVMAGLLASYVGITAKAAGGERIYRGILSKPGRMGLLALCSITAFVTGPASTGAWAAFGPLLLAGTSLTLVERVVVATRRLP
jgi:CDP-diacylglycerol--glycerol-3-phosphate 3-phosphatidyltransferase